MSSASLDVEALVRTAQARTGADPGAFRFLEPLSVLSAALETQADLTPRGREVVRGALVSSLATQVRLQRATSEHPEVAEIPIARPVFVIGLLRTGTTLVHNLLAQHPRLRAPQLWELLHPATEGTRTNDQLADQAAAYVADYHRDAPRLPAVHYLDARRPDECHRLLGNAFQSMVYEMRFRVPDYADWLRRQDLGEAYDYHRHQLRHILWRVPGEIVALKCPFHLWHLDALARGYPDARFVHLHRDPKTVVASTGSLCAVLRAARSERVDHHEIGRQWLAQVERAIDGLAAGRGVLGAAVLDVRYDDLLRDTIGTMRRIADFVDAPLTGPAEQRMRAYLAANPQRRHGLHRYRPEDFGLDPAALDERFADYRASYGV